MKYFDKSELAESNRQAIESCCTAIDPDYMERLPRDDVYPIYSTLPCERDGWVRCQIGTGMAGEELCMDVPQAIYENLSSIEEEEE